MGVHHGGRWRMVDYERFRALHPEQENNQAEEKTEARHAGAEVAGGAEMVGNVSK